MSHGAPDSLVGHRTLSGAPATSADRWGSTVGALTFGASGLSGGALDRSCRLSGAPPDSPEAPQVRAPTVEPQRSADVAGAPDSVRWRTGLSGAPCDSTLPTTIFGGWGYKYPNHPTFNGIQVSTLLHLTRAITFNTRHTKEIKSSPNSTQSFSD